MEVVILILIPNIVPSLYIGYMLGLVQDPLTSNYKNVHT